MTVIALLMNKQYLFHGIWLIAALGAYGLGVWNRDRAETGATTAGAGVVRTPGLPEVSLRRIHQGEEGGAAAGTRGAEATAGHRPLTQAEVEAVAREAFNDPNPLKRQLAFARLLEGMTPENAEAIGEQLLAGKASGEQWRVFQYAWGALDAKGALAAAATIKEDGRRNGAISQALSGWASAQPTDAIAWLNGVENKDEKNRLMNSLVGGLADYDIGFATNFVMDLAAQGNERAGDHMRTVAGEQVRKDGPEGAARWAESLADGDLKGAALERVVNSYVDRDPEAAAAWAAQFATTDYGAQVIDEVGEEWGERNPAAAVDWLLGLPDSRGKAAGMHSALGEWARRDPTAASQYLIDMPQSPLKDDAVGGFVRHVAWEDPEAAMAWARTIAQESTRQEAMTRAAQAWITRDREAALQWLPTSGLTAEQQKRVLETRRRNRG